MARLGPALDRNLRTLQQAAGEAMDLRLHRFRNPQAGLRGCVVFAASVTDEAVLARDVVAPLLELPSAPQAPAELTERLRRLTLRQTADPDKLLCGVFQGNPAVLVDGMPEAFLLSVATFPRRKVDSTDVEPVVRGPHEAFTETLGDNIGLIRRSLPDPRLQIRPYRIGRRTATRVALVYLSDVTPQRVVDEVDRRLRAIDVDGITESQNIEEMIKDHTWTPFPLMRNTERVDVTVAGLLQGQFAILTDRTPLALLAPATLFDFLQSPEDYNSSFYFAALVRGIRFLAAILSTVLPAAYVALIGYAPELLPTELALSIAGTRQGIPLPAVAEVLLLDVIMEVLREATARMPRGVGQTIGVVGGLIVGTAAVEAGIVSNIMIIIVAMTALSSFATPSWSFSLSTRVLKYILILPAVVLGLFGLVLGMTLLLLHLVALESFGTPYLAPLSPRGRTSLRDVLARAPAWRQRVRPGHLNPRDRRRLRPQPLEQDEYR